jgi:hypothetical protein
LAFSFYFDQDCGFSRPDHNSVIDGVDFPAGAHCIGAGRSSSACDSTFFSGRFFFPAHTPPSHQKAIKPTLSNVFLGVLSGLCMSAKSAYGTEIGYFSHQPPGSRVQGETFTTNDTNQAFSRNNKRECRLHGRLGWEIHTKQAGAFSAFDTTFAR